ncbi:MAG: hypothetical protein WD847_15970 [Pirellulales bacterium]
MSMLAVLLAVFAFTLCIGAIGGIGYWILHPLDRAARNRRMPTQFTMVDFLCLVFLVQFPMGVIHAAAGSDERRLVWVFDILAWIATGMMWWISVSTLSRAGVRHTWQRAAFLALVLPVAYFGSIATVVLPFAIFVEFDGRPAGIWIPLGVVLAEGLLVLAFYLAARYTRRIVAIATAEQLLEVDETETADLIR